SLFFFSRTCDLRLLHSFPTRRSSDLPVDMLNPLTPFWNPNPIVVNITALRNFDSAVSPYTWWSQQWANTQALGGGPPGAVMLTTDRKSTRLNSSHVAISYAVCCLKKK